MVPEGPQASAIGGHRVIREVPADYLPEPLTLKRDRFVHASLQFGSCFLLKA
jgi:hypothetical protein